MRRVIVAGGGLSGLSAASSAEAAGASVTLVEKSSSLGRPESLLPLLTSDPLPSAGGADSLRGRGVDLMLGERVVALDAKQKTAETDRGSKLRFDSAVIATGSSIAPVSFAGSSKPNVHQLGDEASYLKLAKALGGISSVALLGSSPLALSVADVLVGRGIRVTCFTGSGGFEEHFSHSVDEAVREAASSYAAGPPVAVLGRGIESAAGVARVEAVVSDGEVFPCECLVTVPRRVASLPAVAAARGRFGCLLVDERMESSVAGIYAAGDCAEARFMHSSIRPDHQPAKLMGEVAGANAAGKALSARIVGAVSLTVFGLEICAAGPTLGGLKSAGVEAREASLVLGSGGAADRVVCSIVFDSVSGAVYGVQLAGRRASSYAEAASVISSMRIGVRELSYLESPQVPGLMSDPSPITLTARRAATMIG